MDAFPTHYSQPELTGHFVKFVGGAAAATKLYGPGVTVTYSGTGLIDLVWAENPGTFLGMTWGLHATAPAAVKGMTITCGDFNATTRTLRLNIFSSAFALADLAAAQWAMIDLKFKQTAV